MRMEKEKDKVYFLLEEKELEPYDVTLEQFRLMKPFKADIVDDLADKALKEYGKHYDYEFGKMKITVFASHVMISMTEKSNIVYLENSYTEEEKIIDGIQGIYRYLPDDKIYTGVMDAEERRELLEKLRGEEGRELIREDVRKYGGYSI